MNKLAIWNKNKKLILDRIALCTFKKERQHSIYRKRSFPLSDILKDFYRDADLFADFFSMENLKLLYDEYIKEHEGISFTLDLLQEEGWILVMFGRWSSSLENLSVWENVQVGNEYRDKEIIRFLIWLKKQSRNKYNLKLSNPEDKLKRWRMLYPDVPDVEWFKQHDFILDINDEYFVYRAYTYSPEIDKALADLWLEWKSEKPSYWMKIARALKGDYSIFEYLPEVDKRDLFLYIQNNYFYKMAIPDYKQTNKSYIKKRLLESVEYLKNADQYQSIGLWSGNRVLDQKNYNRFGFEYYRSEYVHHYDSMLLLYPMLLYMKWGVDSENISFCKQLVCYDQICEFNGFNNYSTSLLYEMLITKGTFYMAFRELVCYNRDSVLSEEEFENAIVQIVAKIFEEGCKEIDFLDGYEVGMCLFELLYIKKQKKWGDNSLFERIADIVGQESCFEVIGNGLLSYFQGLLQIEDTVEWIDAYHMILICMKRWFYLNLNNQKLNFYQGFLDVVWEGYKIIFQQEGEYVKYLNVSYFEPELCHSIYINYIQEQKISIKREMLFSKIYLNSDMRDTKPYYYFRNLLEILYHILELQSRKDEVVRSVFIEVLEHVLLRDDVNEQQIDREWFDYTCIQIYSAENIIAKCVGTLSSGSKTEHTLMKQLLKKDIPDLLIYFEATTDQKFKMELKKKIEDNATIDSLDVYHDERAIDIVMDNQIESLYPAVERLIEKKLSIWKERGINENSNFVKYAIHQQWRLKYIRREYKSILEGNNLFFQAIVYTEIEEYKNFTKADSLWRKMIEAKDGEKCPAVVYLNYLYLLNRELETNDDLEKDHLEYVNNQYEWVCRMIETEKIQDWRPKEQENYVWFVIQQKKRREEDYLLAFYSYKNKYQISISLEEFINNGQSETRLENTIPGRNNTDNDISNMFQAFWAQTLDKRASMYYQAKGIVDIVEKNSGQTLLVDAVLTTCDALYNFGPQLVCVKENSTIENVKKENKCREGDNKYKYNLYEDNVTILFREIFNHAFGNSIKLFVTDQSKIGTTGNCFGGCFSAAEIDLIFQYDEALHEIAECFVLKDNTSKTVFRDHMGKIIGNNTRHEPLSFMLIYGNTCRNSELDGYFEYLQNEAQNDFKESQVAKMELLEFEKAPYYIHEFERKYAWLKVKRQKILFLDGREQEVLHIFIDIAKRQEAEIRRKSKNNRLLGIGNG